MGHWQRNTTHQNAFYIKVYTYGCRKYRMQLLEFMNVPKHDLVVLLALLSNEGTWKCTDFPGPSQLAYTKTQTSFGPLAPLIMGPDARSFRQGHIQTNCSATETS